MKCKSCGEEFAELPIVEQYCSIVCHIRDYGLSRLPSSRERVAEQFKSNPDPAEIRRHRAKEREEKKWCRRQRNALVNTTYGRIAFAAFKESEEWAMLLISYQQYDDENPEASQNPGYKAKRNRRRLLAAFARTEVGTKMLENFAMSSAWNQIKLDWEEHDAEIKSIRAAEGEERARAVARDKSHARFPRSF